MQTHYAKNQPIMRWLYAGPFELDVSDRYMDNYIVPFEPYDAFWQEAVSLCDRLGEVREGDACALFGQQASWRLAQVHEADRQLTWARFGVSATLLCTLATTQVCVEREGCYALHLQVDGSARLLVNGQAAWEHRQVGRVRCEQTVQVRLRKGDNAITVLLLNVHLHCLNVCQMTLDAPCTARLTLLALPQALREEVERTFAAFYLCPPVLLDGETASLCVDALPAQGRFLYTVCDPCGQAIAKGSVQGAGVPAPVLDDGARAGVYSVHLAYEHDGVCVKGPELSVRRVELMREAPQTDLAGRKRFLLAHSAAIQERGQARTQIYIQLARMAAGRSDLLDEAAIDETLAYVNARYDCADFAMHGVLRFYLKYADHPAVSQGLRERLRACILGFKYWVDEPGKSLMFTRSENHEILFYSAEYLAGLAFPTQVFSNSGQNGLFHALKGRINAEHWIGEKGHYGFTEWHSNTYYEEDLLALVNILDFGEENGLLRQMAKQLMDVIVLLIASNSSQGVMATTHGRCYEQALMYPVTEGMSRVNYLFFGRPRRLSAELSIGAVALADSAYAPPAVAAKMEARMPLHTRTRMGLFRRDGKQGVVCSTYRTAHYMVSGLVESSAGEHGAQVNAGQALLEGRTPVFVTCFADRSPTTRPSYFGGQYRIPKTLACRNVLAYIFRIQGELGFTHCYFPTAEMDEVRRTASWLFARKGDAYIALHCTAPYTLTQGGAYNGRELLCLHKEGTWLLELGDRDAYAGFDAFAEAISAAELRTVEDGLIYRSPSQGELHLRWTGACTCEGKPLCEEDAPLFENPLAYSAYGSGKMRLENGSVIDFFA